MAGYSKAKKRVRAGTATKKQFKRELRNFNRRQERANWRGTRMRYKKGGKLVGGTKKEARNYMPFRG